MKNLFKSDKNIFIILVAVLFLYCTQGGNSLSGGVGAGNPVTLSVIAKGMNGSGDRTKRNTYSESHNVTNTHSLYSSNSFQMNDTLHLQDCMGMNINVTDVNIVAREVYFPIPQNVDISSIPEDMLDNSNNIKIEGSYIFNILKGTCEPPLDTILLPNGIYESVGLSIMPLDNDSLLQGFEIVLCGTLKMMMMESRSIKIYIHSNEEKIFEAINGGIEITQDNLTPLSLELNEQAWLEEIDIKSYMMSGEIEQDSEGNFILEDDGTGVGKKAELCKKIRKNIFNSGILKLK